MEAVMTEFQYKSILQSIKMIISSCNSIEEAQEKLDILLGKEMENEKKKGEE